MNKTILKARVGSHLYGLDTEDSDEDFLGVFVGPAHKTMLLQFGPKAETKVYKDPDMQLHEVRKFMWLAAGKGNPTVMELLFCPEYLILTEEGQMLVENRDAFLSNKVRASFGGYAKQQIDKLIFRTKQGKVGFNPAVTNRYEKHARHCFRLFQQGQELIETGTLNPVVKNREELFAIGKITDPEELLVRFNEADARFKSAVSVLPDEPNWPLLNEIFLKIRTMNP